jgi:ketosteroid isomerase-like protein
MYAAHNRGDWAAFLAQLDPDAEWAPADGFVYRGQEAIRKNREDWLAGWAEIHSEPERIEVSPDRNRILVTTHVRGTNARSQIPVEGRFFHIFELGDGGFVRGSEYLDEAEARAAFDRDRG